MNRIHTSLTWVLAILADTFLVAFSFFSTKSPMNSSGDADTRALQRLVAALLASQAISCYMLTFSLVFDCLSRGLPRPISVQKCRAANVSCSLTAFALCVASLPLEPANKLQLTMGMTTIALSACSLCFSYCPSLAHGVGVRESRPTADHEQLDPEGTATTPLLAEDHNEELVPANQEDQSCILMGEDEGGHRSSIVPSEGIVQTDVSFEDRYELRSELGMGAFSTVREGLDKETNITYAIKAVEKSKLTPQHERALKDEISCLSELNHPNIIRLFQVFDEANSYYLVMEKLDGGELFDRIEKKSHYNEKEARDTALILFGTIQYCHQHKVAHRDLKPENLLLLSDEDDSNIKIADFGFAKKCPTPNCLTTQCGTPAYVAPEILERKAYDTQVDMWSLGVVVFILLGGYPPFYEQNERALYRKIRRGKFHFHTVYWSRISESAKDLIRSLLVVDPSKRSSAEDVLEHAWIQDNDEELQSHDLDATLSEFKKFNAKRKMKAAVQAVVASQKLPSFGLA